MNKEIFISVNLIRIWRSKNKKQFSVSILDVWGRKPRALFLYARNGKRWGLGLLFFRIK